MGTAQTAALAWAAFPLTLLAISAGLGLLLDAVSGGGLARSLSLPFGFAAFVVLGQFTTAWPATALLTMPLAVGLALLGLILGRMHLRSWTPNAIWGAAAAGVTYAVQLLPVIASGTPTFAGWIKLDDGATWLAFADRMVEAGRTITGLAPSTYEALLKINLVDGNPAGSAGYPIGAFVPLGAASRLLGVDPAWTLQPYMAFLAGLLTLVVFHLLRRLIDDPRWRALAAVVSSCSALLYGYALWGGVKELALAPLIALTVYALFAPVRRPQSIRAVLPVAVAAASLLAIAGPSGALWIVPATVVAAIVEYQRAGAKATGAHFSALLLCTAVMSIPALALVHVVGLNGLAKFAATSNDIGNLWGHLRFAQIAGVWPVGDFREVPAELGPVMIVVVLIAALAFAGVARAVRDGEPTLATLVISAVAFAAVTAFGNAWVGGKALAMASPLVLAAAFAGVGWLLHSSRRVEAICAVLVITGGVIWSDALQYREAWLAPYGQLHELEIVGELAGLQAPALYTDTTVYGARHFLRHLDAEGASDLRRNLIPLQNGEGLNKGQFADIDVFALGSVEQYRTLVVRRSGLASRPPSNFRLVWQGDYYEAWQRESEANTVLFHRSIGDAADPAAVPPCSTVSALAKLVGARGRLAYVERTPVVTLPLPADALPAGWYPSSTPRWLVPPTSGSLDLPLNVSAAGEYGVWLSGSFRGALQILIDGKSVLEARHWLSMAGTQLPGDRVQLTAGRHTVTLRYDVSAFLPGAAGSAFAIGPITFAQSTADLPVATVAASQATSLCGRSLDWVEALSN